MRPTLWGQLEKARLSGGLSGHPGLLDVMDGWGGGKPALSALIISPGEK